MAHSIPNDNKLSALQLEMLKSLKYMATEKQLADVKSLLRHYFARQLDTAIEKTEKEKNYTADIYESWLKSNPADTKSTDA
jgi:hypothetical protein